MAPRTHSLTQERALALFNYNPKTGIVRHKRNNAPAGSMELKRDYYARKDETKPVVKLLGRVRVNVDGVNHNMHNVIYLMQTGKYPPRDCPGYEIDHDDFDGFNNRWRNLKLRTCEENRRRHRPKHLRDTRRPTTEGVKLGRGAMKARAKKLEG